MSEIGQQLRKDHFDVYDLHRKYIQHQDELVNQRLNRLFLAHASLAAVPGLLISKTDHPFLPFMGTVFICFSCLGITLCVIQDRAIRAGLNATRALARSWTDYEATHKLSGPHFPGIIGGGEEQNAKTGRRMTLCAPWIPGSIWFGGLIAGLCLHLRPHWSWLFHLAKDRI